MTGASDRPRAAEHLRQLDKIVGSMPLVCVLVAGSIHGKWQPISVFLPGESHGQRKPGGLQSTESQSRTRPKRLSKHACPL